VAESNPYRPPRASLEDATAANPDPPRGSPWRVIALVGIAGLAVGVVSRQVRPLIRGPIHYDAVAAMALQVSLALAVVVAFRRRQLPGGILYLNLAIAALWGSFFVGWTVNHGHFWHDFVSVTTAFWIGSASVGSLMLFVLHRLGKGTES